MQYISKQLSGSALNWATIEKEAFAVVHALNKMRQSLRVSVHYLYRLYAFEIFIPLGSKEHQDPEVSGFAGWVWCPNYI